MPTILKNNIRTGGKELKALVVTDASGVQQDVRFVRCVDGSGAVSTVYDTVKGYIVTGGSILEFSYGDIPADGTPVLPTLRYAATVRQQGESGELYGEQEFTSGATVTFSGEGVDAETGAVSASSLGANPTERTKITTVTVNVSYEGSGLTATFDVYQQANTAEPTHYADRNGTVGEIPVYGTPTAPVLTNSLTATGGQVICSGSTVKNSRSYYLKYASGEYSGLVYEEYEGTVAYKISSNGNNRFSINGINILHENMTNNGVTDTVGVVAYNVDDESRQSAQTTASVTNNYTDAWGDISITSFGYASNTIDGAGATSAAPNVKTAIQSGTRTFDTGYTQTIATNTFTWSYTVSGTGFTVASSTGKVTAAKYTGTEGREGVVTATAKANGKSATAQFTFLQTMTISAGATVAFAYTGGVQMAALPTGKYKLQCWGAQGGSNAAASTYSITAQAGGKGGYSEGVLTLTSGRRLYAFVGGQGSSSGNGGWNGGGGGSGSSSYNASNTNGVSRMGCGGGATDIALVTSSMSYSSYRTNRSSASLLSRIIVAGGGSGGAMCYQSKQTTSTNYNLYGSYSIESTPGNTLITNGNIYNLFNSPWYISDIYINNTTLKQGDIIRVTLGKTLNSNSHVRIGFRNSASDNSWASSSYVEFGRSEQLSSFEYTIPSHTSTNVFNISVRTDDGFFGSSVKVEIKTTSTNTSTSNDKQVGYVGGGTNGAGYSSTYYGKQNGAGTNGGFGYGANMTTTNYRYCSACGGGGWYGGGSTYSDTTITYVRYSGGGSGFVNTSANSGYRPSGYTGLQLDSGETKAGNVSFPSTSGGTETGHSGHGYAIITRIS